MTIHFAAARNIKAGIVSRCLGLPMPARAANDNGDAGDHTQVLRASLKFFAEHGLGSALEARLRAEQAWRADRQGDYRHWLAVCRMFDRRMAATLDKRLARAGR